VSLRSPVTTLGALILLVGFATWACGEDVSNRQIRLEPVARIALPTGIVPSGGAISDSGTVVVWDRHARAVLVGDTTLVPVCVGRLAGPVAVAIGRTNELSILDQAPEARGATVWSVTPTGECSSAVSVALGRVATAARLGDVWIVATAGHTASDALIAIRGASAERWIVPRWRDEPWVPERALITSVSSELLAIASMRPPFRSVVVDGRGRVHANLQVERESSETLESWIGLRVAGVLDTYMQVIADPRSDQRHLVVFDRKGRLLRRQGLSVAMGLLASSQDGRLVLAIRRTGVDEIVLFRAAFDDGAHSEPAFN
jgi:hypothetical protein